jgi:hypothetical protein
MNSGETRASYCFAVRRQRRLRVNCRIIWPKSTSRVYDAAVLGVLGRRGVEAGISLFAVLGFCYVPLGGHTGFEHAKAVFSTPAAKRAGAELVDALIRVRAKLTGEVQEFTSGTGPDATPPTLRPPKRDGGSHPEHHRATGSP